MFRQFLIGQYEHKTAILHLLDPRTKILAMLLLSWIVFQSKTLEKMTMTSAVLLMLIVLGRLSFISLLRNLKPFYFLSAFILLMYVLFSPQQLMEGVFVVWRFVLFVFISCLLTFTTTISDLVTGLEKLLRPLALVKIEPRTVALLIALTIRFIPCFFLYAQRINDAQRARLGNLRQMKTIRTFILKLLERMFACANTVTDALLARNYTPRRNVFFVQLKMKIRDYAAIVLIAALAVLLS